MATLTFLLFLDFLALALSISLARPFLPELENHSFIAEKGQFPYYASLQVEELEESQSSSHYCGGSIIDKTWILTTAHCVAGLEMGGLNFSVVVGVRDFENAESNGTKYEVSEVIRHPKFELYVFDHDIALVKLKDPITFSPNVKSIGLPRIDMIKNDSPVNVSGICRKENEGNGYPFVLKHMTTTIVDRQICEQLVTYGKVEASNICISRTYGENHSELMNYSDGPVVAGDVQVGMVSPVSFWEEHDGNIPIVTTNIFSYLDWIKSHISEKTEPNWLYRAATECMSKLPTLFL